MSGRQELPSGPRSTPDVPAEVSTGEGSATGRNTLDVVQELAHRREQEQREARKRYKRSQRGQDAKQRHERSEKYRETKKRNNRSEGHRAANRSEGQRAASRRYNQSEEGQRVQKYNRQAAHYQQENLSGRKQEIRGGWLTPEQLAEQSQWNTEAEEGILWPPNPRHEAFEQGDWRPITDEMGRLHIIERDQLPEGQRDLFDQHKRDVQGLPSTSSESDESWTG